MADRPPPLRVSPAAPQPGEPLVVLGDDDDPEAPWNLVQNHSNGPSVVAVRSRAETFIEGLHIQEVDDGHTRVVVLAPPAHPQSQQPQPPGRARREALILDQDPVELAFAHDAGAMAGPNVPRVAPGPDPPFSPTQSGLMGDNFSVSSGSGSASSSAAVASGRRPRALGIDLGHPGLLLTPSVPESPTRMDGAPGSLLGIGAFAQQVSRSAHHTPTSGLAPGNMPWNSNPHSSQHHELAVSTTASSATTTPAGTGPSPQSQSQADHNNNKSPPPPPPPRRALAFPLAPSHSHPDQIRDTGAPRSARASASPFRPPPPLPAEVLQQQQPRNQPFPQSGLLAPGGPAPPRPRRGSLPQLGRSGSQPASLSGSSEFGNNSTGNNNNHGSSAPPAPAPRTSQLHQQPPGPHQFQLSARPPNRRLLGRGSVVAGSGGGGGGVTLHRNWTTESLSLQHYYQQQQQFMGPESSPSQPPGSAGVRRPAPPVPTGSDQHPLANPLRHGTSHIQFSNGGPMDHPSIPAGFATSASSTALGASLAVPGPSPLRPSRSGGSLAFGAGGSQNRASPAAHSGSQAGTGTGGAPPSLQQPPVVPPPPSFTRRGSWSGATAGAGHGRQLSADPNWLEQVEPLRTGLAASGPAPGGETFGPGTATHHHHHPHPHHHPQHHPHHHQPQYRPPPITGDTFQPSAGAGGPAGPTNSAGPRRASTMRGRPSYFAGRPGIGGVFAVEPELPPCRVDGCFRSCQLPTTLWRGYCPVHLRAQLMPLADPCGPLGGPNAEAPPSPSAPALEPILWKLPVCPPLPAALTPSSAASSLANGTAAGLPSVEQATNLGSLAAVLAHVGASIFVDNALAGTPCLPGFGGNTNIGGGNIGGGNNSIPVTPAADSLVAGFGSFYFDSPGTTALTGSGSATALAEPRRVSHDWSLGGGSASRRISRDWAVGGGGANGGGGGGTAVVRHVLPTRAAWEQALWLMATPAQQPEQEDAEDSVAPTTTVSATNPGVDTSADTSGGSIGTPVPPPVPLRTSNSAGSLRSTSHPSHHSHHSGLSLHHSQHSRAPSARGSRSSSRRSSRAVGVGAPGVGVVGTGGVGGFSVVDAPRLQDGYAGMDANADVDGSADGSAVADVDTTDGNVIASRARHLEDARSDSSEGRDVVPGLLSPMARLQGTEGLRSPQSPHSLHSLQSPMSPHSPFIHQHQLQKQPELRFTPELRMLCWLCELLYDDRLLAGLRCTCLQADSPSPGHPHHQTSRGAPLSQPQTPSAYPHHHQSYQQQYQQQHQQHHQQHAQAAQQRGRPCGLFSLRLFWGSPCLQRQLRRLLRPTPGLAAASASSTATTTTGATPGTTAGTTTGTPTNTTTTGASGTDSEANTTASTNSAGQAQQQQQQPSEAVRLDRLRRVWTLKLAWRLFVLLHNLPRCPSFDRLAGRAGTDRPGSLRIMRGLVRLALRPDPALGGPEPALLNTTYELLTNLIRLPSEALPQALGLQPTGVLGIPAPGVGGGSHLALVGGRRSFSQTHQSGGGGGGGLLASSASHGSGLSISQHHSQLSHGGGGVGGVTGSGGAGGTGHSNGGTRRPSMLSQSSSAHSLLSFRTAGATGIGGGGAGGGASWILPGHGPRLASGGEGCVCGAWAGQSEAGDSCGCVVDLFKSKLRNPLLIPPLMQAARATTDVGRRTGVLKNLFGVLAGKPKQCLALLQFPMWPLWFLRLLPPGGGGVPDERDTALQVLRQLQQQELLERFPPPPPKPASLGAAAASAGAALLSSRSGSAQATYGSGSGNSGNSADHSNGTTSTATSSSTSSSTSATSGNNAEQLHAQTLTYAVGFFKVLLAQALLERPGPAWIADLELLLFLAQREAPGGTGGSRALLRKILHSLLSCVAEERHSVMIRNEAPKCVWLNVFRLLGVVLQFVCFVPPQQHQQQPDNNLVQYQHPQQVQHQQSQVGTSLGRATPPNSASPVAAAGTSPGGQPGTTLAHRRSITETDLRVSLLTGAATSASGNGTPSPGQPAVPPVRPRRRPTHRPSASISSSSSSSSASSSASANSPSSAVAHAQAVASELLPGADNAKGDNNDEDEDADWDPRIEDFGFAEDALYTGAPGSLLWHGPRPWEGPYVQLQGRPAVCAAPVFSVRPLGSQGKSSHVSTGSTSAQALHVALELPDLPLLALASSLLERLGVHDFDPAFEGHGMEKPEIEAFVRARECHGFLRSLQALMQTAQQMATEPWSDPASSNSSAGFSSTGSSSSGVAGGASGGGSGNAGNSSTTTPATPGRRIGGMVRSFTLDILAGGGGGGHNISGGGSGSGGSHNSSSHNSNSSKSGSDDKGSLSQPGAAVSASGTGSTGRGSNPPSLATSLQQALGCVAAHGAQAAFGSTHRNVLQSLETEMGQLFGNKAVRKLLHWLRCLSRTELPPEKREKLRQQQPQPRSVSSGAYATTTTTTVSGNNPGLTPTNPGGYPGYPHHSGNTLLNHQPSPYSTPSRTAQRLAVGGGATGGWDAAAFTQSSNSSCGASMANQGLNQGASGTPRLPASSSSYSVSISPGSSASDSSSTSYCSALEPILHEGPLTVQWLTGKKSRRAFLMLQLGWVRLWESTRFQTKHCSTWGWDELAWSTPATHTSGNDEGSSLELATPRGRLLLRFRSPDERATWARALEQGRSFSRTQTPGVFGEGLFGLLPCPNRTGGVLGVTATTTTATTSGGIGSGTGGTGGGSAGVGAGLGSISGSVGGGSAASSVLLSPMSTGGRLLLATQVPGPPTPLVLNPPATVSSNLGGVSSLGGLSIGGSGGGSAGTPHHYSQQYSQHQYSQQPSLPPTTPTLATGGSVVLGSPVSAHIPWATTPSRREGFSGGSGGGVQGGAHLLPTSPQPPLGVSVSPPGGGGPPPVLTPRPQNPSQLSSGSSTAGTPVPVAQVPPQPQPHAQPQQPSPFHARSNSQHSHSQSRDHHHPSHHRNQGSGSAAGGSTDGGSSGVFSFDPRHQQQSLARQQQQQHSLHSPHHHHQHPHLHSQHHHNSPPLSQPPHSARSAHSAKHRRLQLSGSSFGGSGAGGFPAASNHSGGAVGGPGSSSELDRRPPLSPSPPELLRVPSAAAAYSLVTPAAATGTPATGAARGMPSGMASGGMGSAVVPTGMDVAAPGPEEAGFGPGPNNRQRRGSAPAGAIPAVPPAVPLRRPRTPAPLAAPLAVHRYASAEAAVEHEPDVVPLAARAYAAPPPPPPKAGDLSISDDEDDDNDDVGGGDQDNNDPDDDAGDARLPLSGPQLRLSRSASARLLARPAERWAPPPRAVNEANLDLVFGRLIAEETPEDAAEEQRAETQPGIPVAHGEM